MFFVRLLRRGLIVVGCALLLLVAGAFVFERAGGVERLVRRALQDAIAHEPGLRVQLDAVTLDWTGPRATVRGLTISGADGSLVLDEAMVVLDASDPSAPVSAVDVRGGRLVLTDGFLQAMGRAVAGPVDEDWVEDEDWEPEPLRFPLVNVTDLEVALGGDGWGGAPLELGLASARVEGSFEDDGQHTFAIGTVAMQGADGVVAPLFYRADVDHGAGVVAFAAAARELSLQSRGNRLRRLLPASWRGLDVEALASLDLTGRAVLDGSAPVTCDVRYRLSGGYLRANEQLPALEGLALEGALRIADGPAESVLARAEGTGSFEGQVVGETLAGSVALQDGSLVVRAAADAVTLSDRRLAELGLEEDHPVRREWSGLAFDGRADLGVGLRVGLADPRGTLDVTAAAVLDGQSRAQYNGFPSPDYPRQGVPVPIDQLEGRVAMVFDARHPQPTLVGILEVAGRHGTGPVRARGMIASPRVPAPEGLPETPDLDLFIEVDDRALDASLASALAGMEGTAWIWDAFQPQGGVADALVALRARHELDGLTAFVDLHVEDSGLRWEGFPIGVGVDALDLQLVWAPTTGELFWGYPYRALGARFEARGSSASVEELTLSGMLRGASFEAPEELNGLSPLSFVRVEAPGLALRGPDFEELGVVLPAVAELGAELGTKGRVDVVYQDVDPGFGAPVESRLGIVPRTVELLPAGFPMVTRGVEGAVTMAATATRGADGEREATGTWRARLVGDWPGGMRVGASYRGTFDEDEPGMLAFTAGGLDPSNRALLGAIASGQGSEVSQASTEGLALDGRVDLSGELRMTGEDARPDLELHLRGNRFVKDALVVEDLIGSLSVREGLVQGPRITGTLAGTELVLQEVRFAFDAAARTSDEYFSTLLSATDVPLDVEHLGAFLEPETLAALFEEFEWSGRVDLDRLRLALARGADGRESTRLAGSIRAREVSLAAGVPTRIERAQVELREFVLEGGRARAWGTVEGLEARVAERELEGGSFLFSYVDQRLTVQGLETNLAGGKLVALGGRSATALAIDLAPPYHMAVSVLLTGVDAGPMVADAFGGARESGAQNEGKLDASIRFQLVPGELLDATGAGWIRLREARLWSIPVFRELFTQLGYDTTGVFDSMRTSFTIRDGRFLLTQMRAHSPILLLVGDGVLDMNGDMSFDLEVRYSLIDKLGPLRYIVYWFQNALLRMEVRGDIYRPVVILRNAVWDVFKQKYQNAPRLPLPYPDPLPPRF